MSYTHWVSQAWESATVKGTEWTGKWTVHSRSLNTGKCVLKAFICHDHLFHLFQVFTLNGAVILQPALFCTRSTAVCPAPHCLAQPSTALQREPPSLRSLSQSQQSRANILLKILLKSKYSSPKDA